jgi:hypothetical protein
VRTLLAITLFAIVAYPALSLAQPAPTQPASTSPNPLRRQYTEGQKLAYHMKGQNESWHYEIDADGIVKKDPSGRFFEEYRWSNMISDGHPLPLAPSADNYRQRLSLDPAQNPSAPDLKNADPKMIGPITDLMTFYVDLWLPAKLGVLHKPGDHFYFHNFMPPSSWADGKRVLVGEDAIDFDMTFKSFDPGSGTALVEVKHVPPQKSALPFKADWMKEPVASAPNNWVEITKSNDGKFEAAVGLETFTVELTVSTTDGHIVSATMQNPVITIERLCEDEALTKCSAPKRHEILRQIQIAAKP